MSEDPSGFMSDTPRTDAVSQPRGSPFECVPADFARALERELAAMTAERDALRKDKARLQEIHIVFDGPPSHDAGRFVEVEDKHGNGLRLGRWEEHSPYWHLIFDAAMQEQKP